MGTLIGLKASDVIVEAFEDAGEGRCCRSWCVSSASVGYSSTSSWGKASGLNGEICVRGVPIYAFLAAEASFEKIDKPSPGVRVTGKIDVEDLERGVRLSCQQLAWVPAFKSLSLDGDVIAEVPSKWRVSCAKLSISSLERHGSLEDTVSFVYEQRRTGCVRSLAPGNSAVLHGPCQGWAKVPGAAFAGPSLGLSSSKLSAEMYDIAFSATEIFFDMDHQALMAQGPLTMSCLQNRVQVSAGAGDLLLGEGILALHGGVCGRLKDYELNAPTVNWFYAGGKEAGEKQSRWFCKKWRITRGAERGGDDSVRSFMARVGQMLARRPRLDKMLKIIPFCRATRIIAAGENVKKILVRPRECDVVTSLASDFFRKAVVVNSSGLRVEIGQLLTHNLLGLGRGAMNFGVFPLCSFGGGLEVREKHIYPILAASELKREKRDVLGDTPILLRMTV